jgi:hypothetical protein
MILAHGRQSNRAGAECQVKNQRIWIRRYENEIRMPKLENRKKPEMRSSNFLPTAARLTTFFLLRLRTRFGIRVSNFIRISSFGFSNSYRFGRRAELIEQFPMQNRQDKIVFPQAFACVARRRLLSF